MNLQALLFSSKQIHPEEVLVDNYLSLVKLQAVNEKDRTIELEEGNYFAEGGK